MPLDLLLSRIWSPRAKSVVIEFRASSICVISVMRGDIFDDEDFLISFLIFWMISHWRHSLHSGRRRGRAMGSPSPWLPLLMLRLL